MKVRIQLADLGADYKHTDILELRADATLEMIPAVCELFSVALKEYLTTKAHASLLGVDTEQPDPE